MVADPSHDRQSPFGRSGPPASYRKPFTEPKAQEGRLLSNTAFANQVSGPWPTIACNFVPRATDAITLFPAQRGDQDRWRKVSGGVREGGPSPTIACNFVLDAARYGHASRSVKPVEAAAAADSRSQQCGRRSRFPTFAEGC
jgi:hypothetical protein